MNDYYSAGRNQHPNSTRVGNVAEVSGAGTRQDREAVCEAGDSTQLGLIFR